jgi:hypothetical protein
MPEWTGTAIFIVIMGGAVGMICLRVGYHFLYGRGRRNKK